MKTFDLIVLIGVAVLLLAAAIDKLLHFEGFVNAVANYVLAPRGWEHVIAPTVITTEVVLGAGLLFPRFRSWALPASLALFVIFSAAVAANLIYGSRGICGCWFTFTLGQSNEVHLAQNLLISLLLGILWFERSHTRLVISCEETTVQAE